MSIKVNNISKIYGEQNALNDVSFEVNTGEIVGFLGPNGAGKSTMMKILTCFIPQTSGTASVCGFDISEQSLEVRKHVGYLPEHNPLILLGHESLPELNQHVDDTPLKEHQFSFFAQLAIPSFQSFHQYEILHFSNGVSLQ